MRPDPWIVWGALMVISTPGLSRVGVTVGIFGVGAGRVEVGGDVVEVGANELDKHGIAIDFLDLKKITWQVVGPFDHNNFNEIPPFDKLNPTAENIVKFFYEEIEKLLPVLSQGLYQRR